MHSQNGEKILLATVCLSVRMEQIGSNWTDFHKIWYFSIFRKTVDKIQVLLKSDKNNGYFSYRPMYIYNTSPNSSYNQKRFRQKSQRKPKHIIYVEELFFSLKILPFMR